MDWLVLPLAITLFGGALGGSSGRDTLTHRSSNSQKVLARLFTPRSEEVHPSGLSLRLHFGKTAVNFV